VTPLVICTGPGRWPWLQACLDSIPGGVPVTIASSGEHGGGELAAIRMIYDREHWPRWLMIQDSCELIGDGLLRLADDVHGPALVAPRPSMYLAVYERQVLDRIHIPVLPDGDREAAIAHETEFMDAYVAAAEQAGLDVPVLLPDLRDGLATRVEPRHGRMNLVLESAHLRKWKGTWR
jgi:hypothetical protein